jgi:serine/threonine-protein kinase
LIASDGIASDGIASDGHSGGTPVPIPSQGGSWPQGAPQAVPRAGRGPSTAELEGSILADRYRIIKKLGEGGMGSVYLAEHTTINKRLAIKILSSEYTHKQDLVDRFLQEARAASMIEQENVVEITDFGSTPQGSVFFVMEYLNGEDLSETIKDQGQLPWARVKPIMLQICEALAAAHDAGIIHRDMKPENCFRIRRGSNADFIKVLDFGIAKVTSDDPEGGRALTRTGMIFGTPEYMSPEQAKGERVDFRVDIYAVGVIMYELLTGRVPFTADTFMGILTKHMFEAPAAPSTIVPDAIIPSEVEAIILKALQKDREYRFQTMRDMARAIEAVGSGGAAVSVVAEEVYQPASGQIRFKGASTRITGIDPLDAPPRSNVGLFVGLGLLVAVLVGGVGFVALGGFGSDDGEATGAEPPTVAAGAPVDAETKAPESEDDPDAVPVPVPAGVTEVEVMVVAEGVEGQVFDNRDDSLLGKLNEPIKMPVGSEPRDLFIRAPGHEDFLIDVVPNADKKLPVTLTKVVEPVEAESPDPKSKGKKGKKSAKRGKNGSGTVSDAPAETPKKDSPPKKDPPKKEWNSGISGDLKNPFGKKK